MPSTPSDQRSVEASLASAAFTLFVFTGKLSEAYNEVRKSHNLIFGGQTVESVLP
ncbi:MAG: hypothetical protein AB7J13_14240 [Pyrinomonadaceae bacterium]